MGWIALEVVESSTTVVKTCSCSKTAHYLCGGTALVAFKTNTYPSCGTALAAFETNALRVGRCLVAFVKIHIPLWLGGVGGL